MTGHRQFTVLFAGLLALGLVGCASTGMVHSWKDPNYSGGPMSKVLVIGVAASDANRRIFEDRFKMDLATEKVEAISSYTVLPASQLEEEAVRSKLTELTVDGVIISRVVDSKTVETIYPPETTYMGGAYYPGYYGSYYGYYSNAYSYYTSPGYVTTTEYVYVETNLYDAKTGNLVWTGLSETAMDPGRADQLIDGVVNMLMSEIRKAKAAKK
jgi:hypothetical protein